MTFNGQWKPTIPFTPVQISQSAMVGIVEIKVDSRKIKCEIVTRRHQTFARTLESKCRWFQLCLA